MAPKKKTVTVTPPPPVNVVLTSKSKEVLERASSTMKKENEWLAGQKPGKDKVPQPVLDLMLREKKTLLKWRIQDGKYIVHATTLQKWVIPIE